MASGDTKTQQYLDVAAHGTRADVQRGCCDTRTQSLIMDVADRIITEEETRAREDQVLQNEIDEIKNNPDVADIVPTYAALQDYDTSKLTDQDIIRVLADETHDGASTYYRWSTSSQTFTYVGETGDYYTKSQVNDLLDGKQDLLTAGDGITIEEESGALVISSTGGGGGTSNFNQLTNRPSYNGVTMTGSTNIPEVKTYSAGTGLSLTGTAFSIDNTVALKTDIPTVNDATLTITQNGVNKGTFTANDADNTTIELTDNDTTYSAGTNVQISAQNVISATDTTYSAGTGLDLAGTTFSADTTVLATKTDLEGKQDELTAGDNVTIEDESGALVISATDTTYSNFVGTDGTAAGTAGLVPAPATTDAGKFLKADGTWDTAGGSSVNVVQTTGTSTTDVMSQNAVTSMVYADPSTRNNVRVGENSGATGYYSVALGYQAQASGNNNVAIGRNAKVDSVATNAVALGEYALASQKGQMDISALGNGSSTTEGYNNSAYRLLTGLYDPQSAHDAATKGYVDTAVAGAAYDPTISNNTLYL